MKGPPTDDKQTYVGKRQKEGGQPGSFKPSHSPRGGHYPLTRVPMPGRAKGGGGGGRGESTKIFEKPGRRSKKQIFVPEEKVQEKKKRSPLGEGTARG